MTRLASALAAAIGLFALSTVADAQAPAIPLVTGLVAVNAVYEPGKGDYEKILTVSNVDSGGVTFTVAANVDDERISVRRRVLQKDLVAAHAWRFRYNQDDPESFAGTTTALRVSDAVMNDLKTAGRTTVSVIINDDPLQAALGGLFAGTGLSRRIGGQPEGQTGTLARVESSTVAQRVLVNDVVMELPTIHVRGTLGDDEADFFILDSAVCPMVLRYRIGDLKSQTIRITFPVSTAAARLEGELARQRRVEVYGIYFDFAKATIRPESEAVLAEIAGILAKHPDWTLRLEGHTDNIGGVAANQLLSDRRTAAARQALIDRYHVAAARLTSQGFGASRPQDTNDTIEGRARNRRVELVREDASR